MNTISIWLWCFARTHPWTRALAHTICCYESIHMLEDRLFGRRLLQRCRQHKYTYLPFLFYAKIFHLFANVSSNCMAVSVFMMIPTATQKYVKKKLTEKNMWLHELKVGIECNKRLWRTQTHKQQTFNASTKNLK